MAFKLKLPTLTKKSAASSGKGNASVSIKTLPLIGQMPFNQQVRVLGGGVVLSLMVAVVAAVLDYRATSHGQHYLKLSGDLSFLTQRVAKDANAAMQGNQIAIDGLPQARAQTEAILRALDKGDDNAPATSGAPREILNKLLPVAGNALQKIKDIEAARAGLLTVGLSVKVMDELNIPMREALTQLSESGVPPQQVTQLSLLIERIGKDAKAMQGNVVTPEEVGALGIDTNAATELLAELNQANPAVAKVNDLFESYKNSVYGVISQAQALFGAIRASKDYFASVSATHKGPFLTGAQELNQAYEDSLQGRWTSYLLIVAVLTLLALLGLLSQVFLANARQRAADAEKANKQNQAAILRLMNELSDLADGDLTIKATVTEDITGAIADSVNYTTEELRKLVSRVAGAAEQMGEATKITEQVSQGLLDATQKQAQEIQYAGESVDLMSKSIQEVDAAASQATEVGRHTLAATTQGAQAVRNTIAGMDGIREQIQETSKRIKRLGESSQEIGEIVDLISDITEQTNVLALNAAIQAASAGEAGRGFSVVAEEVQRLAERSAEATKQIGALVKTIQSDTFDAVAAMEKSTQGVVEGAKLSEVAGQSLQEIEQVSNKLAALINSISVSTQVQTDMAGEVSSVMQDILKLAEQTTGGTRQSASSVGQLSGLANDLKNSVAGFKL